MVSIIIPCYNCEAWIGETLDSIVVQTYTDWEAIVVNDASTDSSAEIARAYATRDSRIRVEDIPHGGLAQVRNRGIGFARGEMIAFIDSDDLWPRRSLERMVQGLQATGAEMATGTFLSFKDTPAGMSKAFAEADKKLASESEWGVLSGPEAVEDSLYQDRVNSSMWSKLFRREAFDGVSFRAGELYEDLDCFHRIVMRMKRVAFTMAPVYLYRLRGGSLIRTFNRDRLIVLEVTRRIEEHIRAEAPQCLPAATDRRFSANYNMLCEITRAIAHGESRDEYASQLESISAFLTAHAKEELLNPRVRLKNRAGALAWILLPRPLLNKIMTL